MNEVVRAAGGVVVRRGTRGGVEIVLVHRPAYDDWTFPKGKLRPDEDEATGALREVEEEAGLRCHLERLLGSVSYQDRRGRPKTVEYWVMTPLAGELIPMTDEVDEAMWTSIEEARRLLTYKRDRKLLRMLAEELSHYGPDGVPWSPAQATGR
jgi:ADP-ribose pyrophosphatase YjhB (NUDIX family)